MDVAHPISAVIPSLDGEVLQALAGTKMAMTGRQIATLTGRSSHSGVLDALHRLTEQGLVNRVELNHAYLFSLNRDHLAAGAVIELAGLRTKLLGELRNTIASWRIAPVHASLFGSTARGDGDARSDIDLFIVRPDSVADDDLTWNQQLDDLRHSVERWTGNMASPIVRGESQIAQLRSNRPPIVAALLADAIPIAGRPAAELLGAQ